MEEVSDIRINGLEFPGIWDMNFHIKDELWIE